MESRTIEADFLAWRERGDAQALARVFDETAPELYAVARHLARGASDAEDLVQQVFLAAIERAASFERERALRPWLFGILALEARRLRARRAARELEEPPAAEVGPLDALLGAELHAAVAEALAGLPPPYASAVALHLEDGLAPREIAPRLSISSELARTHLSRGLAWLRRALPEGLTAGAWLAPERLAALRERVLASAGSAPAAAPALSALALSALILLPLCAVGGGVAWLLGAKEPAAVSLAGGAQAPPAPTAEAALETSAPTPAREELAAAPADTRARLHGRILLAGGAPAAGTDVRASTFSMAERRSVDLGAAPCDAQGRFALALEVGEGQYVSLRAKLAGFAYAGGNFGLLAPGSDTDAGELVLPRAGVLLGTLVDAQARPLAEGWELLSSADAPQTRPADKRWVFWSTAEVDAASGIARLEGLPAGEMKIVARTKLGFDQIAVVAKIVEGAETAAEFRYDGPDLRARILLRARPRIPGLVAFHLQPSSVKLLRAGEEARTAVAPARRAPGEYLFDGLPDGDYSLEVDDPRFERWTEPHARPGKPYSAALEGAAAVKLRVLGPDGVPLARYGLKITFPDVKFRPNTAELLPPRSLAPADGLVKGLVPVHCSLSVQPEGLAERTLDVPELQRGETRELTLDYQSSVAITGRVVDEQGKALQGADVELTQGDRAGEDRPGVTLVGRAGKSQVLLPIAQRAKTDAEGRFRFTDLERGRWTVRARFSPWLVDDETLALGSEIPPPLELTRPPAGFLAGRLALPVSIDPTAIGLVIDGDPVPPQLHPAQDGTFRAGPLPVGSHDLSAWVPLSSRPGGNSTEEFRTPLDLGRFEILAGNDTQWAHDLGSDLPARIALLVRAGGTALEQGWAVALREDEPGMGRGDSIALGSGGCVKLGLARPARVRLAVVARELGWAWTGDEVLSPAAGETLQRTLDVPLQKHTLRCLDAATKAPLANQEIRWGASLAGLEASARAKTDANGLLELSLPAGRHEFLAGSATQGAAIVWKPGGTDPLEALIRTHD